jgi:excisionase family DNA binding protein
MNERSKEAKDAKEKRIEFLTAAQLAEFLQISETSVHRLRRQGRIPAVKLTPRLIRFNLREVRAALAAQQELELERPRTNAQEIGEQLAFDDLFMETIE